MDYRARIEEYSLRREMMMWVGWSSSKTFGPGLHGPTGVGRCLGVFGVLIIEKGGNGRDVGLFLAIFA